VNDAPNCVWSTFIIILYRIIVNGGVACFKCYKEKLSGEGAEESLLTGGSEVLLYLLV
jgi:hypothetical protein